MLNEVDRNLLERTKQDLLTNPKGFNMDSWGSCIAHRMSVLEVGHSSAMYISDVQPKFGEMFGTSRWPSDLATRYYKARAALSREVPAAIGAEVIDRFLAADGNAGAFTTSKPGSTPKLIPAFFPTKRMEVVKNVATTAVSFLIGIGCVSLVELLMR